MESITDYLEGRLSERQRAKVDAHLAACDGCHTALEQFRVSLRVTGELSERHLDAIAPGVVDELVAAFEAAER